MNKYIALHVLMKAINKLNELQVSSATEIMERQEAFQAMQLLVAQSDVTERSAPDPEKL